MSIKANSGQKTFLLLGVFTLLAAACCVLSGLVFSIPNRTAELYGPPAPELSPWKLYLQSLILVSAQDQLFEPLSPSVPELVFPIEPGESIDSILNGLGQLGYIRHRSALRAYLIYSGIDQRIQPGEYLLPPGLSEVELANLLASPGSQRTILSILAGWRAEEIGEKLPGLGMGIAPEEFVQAVLEENREGYLFPGSYTLERDIAPLELVDFLYQEFLSRITPELENQLAARGLTLQQAVILASIVEREAVLEEEMPLIASVFLNRLGQGMNLGADPTVQYALGYNLAQATWWTNPLSGEDLQHPSPYNTYLNPGLPPGPICSPSLAALQAVANPAESPYLYFRAACDESGRHLFAESYQDHLNNACP